LSAALGAEVLADPADVRNIKSAEGTVLERFQKLGIILLIADAGSMALFSPIVRNT